MDIINLEKDPSSNQNKLTGKRSMEELIEKDALCLPNVEIADFTSSNAGAGVLLTVITPLNWKKFTLNAGA